ncbi:MAG: mechanosensitive ion channel [Flavobacteriales bacterium]|nr:mechanosensitive ion channel [Flavobacteriales bacterium]
MKNGDLGHTIYHFFIRQGFSENAAQNLNLWVLLIITVVFIILSDYVFRKLFVAVFHRFAAKTKTELDDFMVANKVPHQLAHILPLVIAFKVAPLVFSDFEPYRAFADKALHISVVVVILLLVRSFFRTFRDYFKTLDNLKDKPIDSYIQVIMMVAWIMGILTIFAIVTGISFFKFITTLGAASAIIVLIFKDTILGFVASIQVSINDMVHIGDWVTFEKFGADGDVIEINLATVKVQNFDKTITTIPTYSLIADSFRNWRGMMEADGRRIKRAIKLRQNSVHFLTPKEVNKLKRIDLIAEYLTHRQDEINHFNEKNEIDKSEIINGRNLTNLGVFRKYVENYIRHHSAINKEMTIMVRHLEPTLEGIPVEIYAFSKDKRWENYEHIMADIFDHIIAAVPIFGLELFELNSRTN